MQFSLPVNRGIALDLLELPNFGTKEAVDESMSGNGWYNVEPR